MLFFLSLYGEDNESRVALNQPAPSFGLPDFPSNMVSLSDFRDRKNALLVFNSGTVLPLSDCVAHLIGQAADQLGCAPHFLVHPVPTARRGLDTRNQAVEVLTEIPHAGH